MAEHERWVYAGRRISKTNTALHAWMDERGEELIYKGVSGVIGHAYEVEVNRDNGKTSLIGRPSYKGMSAVPLAQIEEWRARDAATQGRLDSQKAEKRAAASNEMQDALNVLRRHYATLRTYGERAGFASYVASEATRPPTIEKED